MQFEDHTIITYQQVTPCMICGAI